MWATEFDRLLDEQSITDAEYAEARDAFKKCATDAGFVVSFLADGSTDTSMGPELLESRPSAEAQDLAVPDMIAVCEPGTTANISYLYESMRGNPDGLSSLEQLRACFDRNDVPDDDGLSDDQFLDLLNGDRTLLSDGARACQEDPERGR